MDLPMLFVQRDNEICQGRIQNLKRVMSNPSLSPLKKWRVIVEFVDASESIDADVRLIRSELVVPNKPVCVVGDPLNTEMTSADVDNLVSKVESAQPQLEAQSALTSAAAVLGTDPAKTPPPRRKAAALSPEQKALIEQNKQRALAAKAAKEAAEEKQKENLKIFEHMQWM
jgi:hypothetical protein